MRYQTIVFTVWLAINLIPAALYNLGVEPTMGTVDSVDPDQVVEAFDVNATVTGWTGETDFTVGDPVFSLWDMWTTVDRFAFTMPAVCQEWGMPAVLANLLRALWVSIWGWYIWDWIRGRD